MEVMTLKEKKKKIAEGILNVLSEKNRRYGNAALEPINIFYKGESTNSILIRLDDKMQRIINSMRGTIGEVSFRKNDMFDLLGYLVLLSISEGYYKSEGEEKEFIEEVKVIINSVFKEINVEPYTDNILSSPYMKFVVTFEGIINNIKYEGVTKERILSLMVEIWKFFIIEDIYEFEDLID